jgi:glycine cleavage system transcriptional repressor
MSHLALSALGRDRPGIVAEMTGVLVEHGVNIEDSRMAILSGEFAMVLVLGAPEGVDRQRLEQDLQGARGRLGLETVTLADLAAGDASPAPASRATHIVSVYGGDHPGIVHSVATALAERGVNIADLTTRLVDEPGGEPLYAMALEVALGASVEADELEAALVAVGRDQGVEVSFRALELDAL